MRVRRLQGSELKLARRTYQAMEAAGNTGAIAEEVMFFEDVDILVAAGRAVVDGGGSAA